ncbi:cyclohexanone monooxygenase [Pseudovirgaria hyperparasitica]|uniref:Cyclohexanone monooxygenase n=1 Tax=Pseudovirgaria hyperparasitica TaxID=470096 RepID=A0A6A6WN61_9PEZI|nr:cyclohexanone monooxygenase [Pseudovirgaria hyperparasitica]KAF2763573.1 cyclohexanone monooxygenase [Pseudovirgaria hyperparasitica]
MSKPWPQLPVGNNDYSSPFVTIIGAGISGLCMAIDLIKRNNCRNFVILERSGGIGGTWRDNKYPGCCCDVFSILYSYSFEQNPNWSRLYPGQEELLEYIIGVAEKYSLLKHIRFNSSVESARWDEEQKKWKVHVSVDGGKDGEYSATYALTTDFLVSAVGQLNAPQMPNIPGLDGFKGKMMHSARWDWTYDLEGKRIGVIGNGATSVQIIPEIAKVASQVTVYQRTPNWVVPRLDEATPAYMKAVYKYVPGVLQRVRSAMMDFRESSHEAVTDKESEMSQLFRSECEKSMRREFPDQPEMWKKLTPEYAPGCKRIIISDDYYPALARDNCSLETRKIERISEKGVVVDGGEEQEFDLLVCATGFKTVQFMYPIDIYGKNGRPFSDIWKDGATAFQGVTVEDAPNFGIFYGPNTNLGHNSIILMIEAQSRYLNELVGRVLKARQSGRKLALYPKQERVAEFNNKAQEILKRTSFNDPGCKSWYKNESGRITNNWYGTVLEYQNMLSKVDWKDYVAEGDGVNALPEEKESRIGRVHEETMISNTTVVLSLLSAVAVAGGVASGRLNLGKLLFAS